MLTYALSGLISAQLRTLDEQQALQERPWRAIESLAIEAERVADQGGDLKTWSQLANTNRLGRVYLFDQFGVEINGRQLPPVFRDASLRPFAREKDAVEDLDGSANAPRGLARTVFLSGEEEPMTLVFLPRSEVASWSDGIPTVLVLILVGLVLTAIGAWLFSRYMVLPIRALFLASENVARGNFSARPGTMFGTRSDELAQLARRFDQMSEELGRASEFQKTLLRDASHELRSPLARLQVAAELFGEQYAQGAYPVVQRIEKEIGEMEALIEEILEVSRFDHDANAIDLERVDLVSIVRELASDANFTAQTASKSVELQCDEPMVMCLVDQKLIKRALQNTIANALQYSPPETTVLVTLERSARLWTIRVCDQGPGVPEHELEAIFRPFYRSSNGRQRRCSGHGIGLALVAKIVQAHDGHVSATNRESVGLEVAMSLPMEPSS